MALVTSTSGQSASVRELSDLRTDGARVGQSAADLVGFYGATPVVQQTNVVTVTTTSSTSSTPFGYTQVQADAIVTAINAVITRMNTLGLFAAS